MAVDEERTVRSPGVVLQYALGAMAAHTVGAVVRLDVPEAIGDDVRGVDEIAHRCGVDESTMVRLVRAMAGLGLCAEVESGWFALTPEGQTLRAGHEQSVRAFVQMFTDPVMLAAWPRLESCVRTGSTAFDDVFGVPFFEYLRRDPEKSALFNASMSQARGRSRTPWRESSTSAGSTPCWTLGGGDGTLLAAVLRANPQLRGAVYDSAEGAAQAGDALREAGVSERSEVIEGDFFTSVAPGFDVHLLKSIVHDWDDDRVVRILGHCRAELQSEGRLLIVEPVLPDTVPAGAAPGPYLSDLNMLVNVGGRERTLADFTDVLSAAGFEMVTAHPLPPEQRFQVIEARPR